MNKSLKEQIFELYEKGYTYREISETLNCSKGTISYHLSHLVEFKKLKINEEKEKLFDNIKNNLPNDWKEFSKMYSSKLTFRESQAFYKTYYKKPYMGTSRKHSNKHYYREKRYAIKKQLVELKGGECVKCGYKKSLRALQFHHTDPNEKEFVLGNIRVINEKVMKELEKCILVCANCHSELHDNNMVS